MFNFKKYFLVLILQISLYTCTGQTIVPGGTVSGTWTLAGSPYQVQGSIMIPNDSLLIVEPGVTVNFNGIYKLLVLGRLNAIGTITDTIVFTTSDTAIGWRGIRFDNTTSNNDSSILQYCKLTYGKAFSGAPDNNGGALYYNNFSKSRIQNCRISFNVANASGGGIYCNNSSPLILNCTITNNHAVYGGGIYCINSNNQLIQGNIVSYNSANFGVGGVFMSSGSSLIYNNEISYNFGRGIQSSGNHTINGNNVSYNITYLNSGGGGISCSGGTTINNTVSYNLSGEASGISCSNSGGGIGSIALVSGNIIHNNIATYTASGPSSSGGGGMYCYGNNVVVEKNIIVNNQSGACGGGVFVNQGSSTFSNNVIANNTGTIGGAFFFLSCPTPIFINNTIANNLGSKGGAFYCYGSSNPTFTNCIFWGNEATISGDQVFLDDESSDPDFYNCDVEGGTAGFETNGGFYLGTYIDNINANPLFAGPSSGAGNTFNGLIADWSLTLNSPCIDSGDSTGTYPATDIAGNPRIINNRIDMGAYEFQGGNWLPEFVSGAHVTIYPNPVTSESVLECEINLKNATMLVFDGDGRLVASRSGINGTRFAIEKLQLQKGTYFYQLLQSGYHVSSGKFMVLK